MSGCTPWLAEIMDLSGIKANRQEHVRDALLVKRARNYVAQLAPIRSCPWHLEQGRHPIQKGLEFPSREAQRRHFHFSILCVQQREARAE